MSQWYALLAYARREKAACASLTELKVEHYLPAETVERVIRREKHRIERPLMPGYVFARIEPEAVADVLKEAHGVCAVVRRPDLSPYVIAPAELDKLRDREASGEFDRTRIPPPPEPREGDTVTIIGDGPLAGRVGAIVEFRSNDRVALLLFGTMVELPLADVALAA